MKELFREIKPYDLTGNFFRTINEDWMLITAGKADHFNTMTASWGTLGIFWNKKIAICFIRPQRYTFEFAERYAWYTLSFFPEGYRDVLNFCGTRSGRDHDKVRETGLKPMETPAGNVIFEQARLALECRILYSDYLKPESFHIKELIPENYPRKDFHKFYIGEIEHVYLR